jgi:hypothetical protein
LCTCNDAQGKYSKIKERHKIWKEAVKMSTLLNRLVIVANNKGEKKSRFEHINKAKPKFVENMRTWGEDGTVKIKTETSTKIQD